MNREMKRIRSLPKSLIVILSKSWWKLLIVSFVFGFISYVNIWLFTNIFLALFAGWISGRIIGKSSAESQPPICEVMISLSGIIISILLLYIYIMLFCSFAVFKPVLTPWGVVNSLKIISSNGYSVQGLGTHFNDFNGSGLQLLWILELAGFSVSSAVAVLIYK